MGDRWLRGLTGVDYWILWVVLGKRGGELRRKQSRGLALSAGMNHDERQRGRAGGRTFNHGREKSVYVFFFELIDRASLGK